MPFHETKGAGPMVGFKSFYTEKGIQGYRMVNLIRRYVEGWSGPLLPGTLGGFVEKPEGIDVNGEIWLFCSARLFGEVKVSGNVVVKDADLTDTTVNGSVRIGREKQPSDNGNPVKMPVRPRKVIIRNSVIDAGDTGRIMIADYASVKRCEIRGTSSILGNVFLVGSTVLSSYVAGFSQVTYSKLDHCRVSDSAVVSGSTLSGSVIRNNAIVDHSALRDHEIRENRCLVGGRPVRDYTALMRNRAE